MKLIKTHGIGVLMLFLLVFPTTSASALSSWPVQKDDQLNYSVSVQFYDENNTIIDDTSATVTIIINNVGNNLTYDITCDVNVKVGDWGNSLKELVEGSNITSTDDFLSIITLQTVIIYEASAFADKENDWETLINTTKEYFWVDAMTFTTYSTDEITNMDFSSSSDAYGYEITATWEPYENLHAGSWTREIRYSEEGVLIKFEETRHWVEKCGGYNWLVKQTNSQAIPGLPMSVFAFYSLLGIIVIVLKKR